MNFNELGNLFDRLTGANRPIRLRLSYQQGVLDDLLLVKRVSGTEHICGGIEYRILCVATDAALPLKQFIGVSAELQFVTDKGTLRSVCGIVALAGAGQSDGGLATYQLVLRDALAIMEMRTSTRVFRNASEIEISEKLLREWRAINPILAKAFDIDMVGLAQTYPQREFIMQHNESDAAFLRRLWKRQGVCWYIRPGASSEHGSSDTRAHTLVLFDHGGSLAMNAAGTVRFHRDAATESADSIFNWSASRALRPGSLTRQSWDYRKRGMMAVEAPTIAHQGEDGDQFAFSLDDYVIDAPHVGDSQRDYQRLGDVRMKRHEYDAKSFSGESGVRDFCVGEWFTFAGHPEIDMHLADEREFVLTELLVSAENNLPKALTDKIRRLFDANGWDDIQPRGLDRASDERGVKYTNRFTCVRRSTPIVPHYDLRTDLPRVTLQSAIVVGPPGEEVLRYSDFFGHSCLVKFTNRSLYEDIEEDVQPGTQGRSRETGAGAGFIH